MGPDEREPLPEADLYARLERFSQKQDAIQQAMTERVARRLSRLADQDPDIQGPTFDVLILSSGAEWGAFGAGFLNGWRTSTDPNIPPFPEFDLISGISTGALLGVYASIGKPERLEEIEAIYRECNPEWIQPMGITAFHPGNPAVATAERFETFVRDKLDERMLRDLRQALAADKSLLVSTTDLDLGESAGFDLLDEATRPDAAERLHQILMAATAVPGMVAPVLLDGTLHADGAAVAGLASISRPEGFREVLAAWHAKHGDRPMPPVRFWIIINNKLGLAPTTVQPRWPSVLYRSAATLAQFGLRAAIRSTNLIASLVAEREGLDISCRWTAVPTNFPVPYAERPFDPGLTNVMADLGRSMGARADSWRTDPDDLLLLPEDLQEAAGS
ncbi:MAG: patatin-like phospholipase family protein [Geminicoccaceae bacterium]